jgi:thiol-disulfide isomerase/thioredoxin
LLAKSVANRYKGEVEFAEESWATSALAQRMGVKYYPAIFVNDVLVARPGDFRAKDGRYAPWIGNAKAHERFQADLARMVDLARRGRMDVVRKESDAAPAAEIAELPRIPSLTLQPLTGEALDLSKRDGTVRLVEFWATWCPPCRGTLAWLGELQRKHPEDLVVLAAAIESDEADVRRIRGELETSLRFGMGSPEMARAFGDLSAVPTLFVFDRQRRSRGSFFGAPPSLHADAERALAEAIN